MAPRPQQVEVHGFQLVAHELFTSDGRTTLLVRFAGEACEATIELAELEGIPEPIRFELRARSKRNSRPLNALDLRMPFGALVRDARRLWADRIEYHAAPEPKGGFYRRKIPAARAALERARGGRPGYGPEHFAEVARVYSAALRAGDRPVLAVAKGWGVSRSAASKWVAKARVLNELGKTDPGKAGGLVRDKRRSKR